MAILVGSTGFVGSHLVRAWDFDHQVHRPNLKSIRGAHTDLLVCAGLPAEKWRANKEPDRDWQNMAALAQVLATVRAERAVLISTIDVYQPAVDVDEADPPAFSGEEAYGSHRAWFEAFFQSHFPETLVVRLPGLFASDVRKNLVHDLLHGKSDQWAGVNPITTFQFFDVTKLKGTVDRASELGLTLLNVSSEPVTAQEVADLFAVRLSGHGAPKHYDIRSLHADAFSGADGYLFTRQSILAGIDELRREAGQ